jgi:hypothetical protein
MADQRKVGGGWKKLRRSDFKLQSQISCNKNRNWLARKVANNKMKFLCKSCISLIWSMQHKCFYASNSIKIYDQSEKMNILRLTFKARMIYWHENAQTSKHFCTRQLMKRCLTLKEPFEASNNIKNPIEENCIKNVWSEISGTDWTFILRTFMLQRKKCFRIFIEQMVEAQKREKYHQSSLPSRSFKWCFGLMST